MQRFALLLLHKARKPVLFNENQQKESSIGVSVGCVQEIDTYTVKQDGMTCLHRIEEALQLLGHFRGSKQIVCLSNTGVSPTTKYEGVLVT